MARQNLGTSAGRNILDNDRGLQIAGNPQNAASVERSGMMSYGSYSGADIKVVVHYPQNTQEVAELHVEQRNLEAEIQTIQDSAIIAGHRYPYLSEQAIARMEILAQELEFVNTALARVRYTTSKTLGEIQTISWGIFRDKAPVRTLGSVYPRSFTRGPRTISGSMIFTVFYEHALHELMDLNLRYYSTGTTDFDRYAYTTMLPDQLPPLDISLIFANEYGALSQMGLYGLEFFQEGGTFSIQDIYSENTLQYVARDLDPISLVSQREVDSHGVTDQWVDTASHMLAREERTMWRQRASNNSYLLRRNPYI